METDLSICFVCKQTFKSVLGHLAKAPDCNNLYPSQLLHELRDKSQKSYAEKRNLNKRKNYDSSKERKRKRTQYYEDQHVRKEIMQNFNPSAPNYKKFFQEIQFGPIFPCICCMKCFSDRGVKVMDQHFHDKLVAVHMADCVDTSASLKINGKYHLCHTCHLKLSKRQMPKLCFKNGLQLSPIPECLKLSSLGNQLLAKYILFLKLREHKKSGFGILNDRVSKINSNLGMS